MTHDFHAAGHLPKVRGDEGANPHTDLPRQRNGITPQMHGRYPDYNCLDETEHWDAATRAVVLARVEEVPAFHFFDVAEQTTLTAFCDVALAQDAEPRIPVLAFVDAKYASGRLDGYQYADMPDDRETWRRVAKGLDFTARERADTGVVSYGAAPLTVQKEILNDFADGALRGGAWDTLNVSRAWNVVMRGIIASFYSHPWAWNEIGFGGPAYPRGYARLGVGASETWEGKEAVNVDPVPDVARRQQ